MFYKLVDQEVIPVDDVIEWGAWMEETRENDGRRVGSDNVNGHWVSTVFLGVDHQYGDGPPLVFETMVFPSEENMREEYMERYSTLEEAEAGHARAVQGVMDGSIPAAD